MRACYISDSIYRILSRSVDVFVNFIVIFSFASSHFLAKNYFSILRSTMIPPVMMAAIVSIFIACELSASFQNLSVCRTGFLQLLGAV